MSENSIVFNILLYGLLAIFLIFAIFPFLWMVTTAFKDGGEVLTYPPKIFPSRLNWESFYKIWTDGNLMIYFFNSLKVASIATFTTILIAIFAAIGFSRYDLPYANGLKVLFLVSQLFPLVLLVTPYYNIMRILEILDTHLALIIAYISFVLPFSVWMLTNYFNAIPRDMEESAMIDGTTKLGAIFRVTLPLAAPGIVATTINAFILAWNEFIFAQTFIDSPDLRTLPIGLRAFMGQYQTDWNLLMAGAVISTIPVIILFMFLQRHVIAGLTSGGVKG